MHVILTILKILGIILLVLLGLLLVIVFSVLFVPVRYRLEGEKIISGMERSKWKSEGFMVTASDSSANTVPGERTGLGVLSFWGTTEKSRSGCQRVEKEEKKKKRYRSRKNREKKQYSRRMNRKKEQLRRKKGRKNRYR